MEGSSILPGVAAVHHSSRANTNRAPTLSLIHISLTVDNQTGGGGILGHQAIADANTDGYTIGMITFELATYKKLGTLSLIHI